MKESSFRMNHIISLPALELNMTPMIDIVFLLISFFTLVVNFTQTEQNERVLLPKSELAQPPEKPLVEPMTIQMTETGEIILGSISCFLEKEASANEISFSKVLKEELRVLQAISSVSPKEVTVIIRGDENVSAGLIQRLILDCQNQGIEKFVLRARQERL